MKFKTLALAAALALPLAAFADGDNPFSGGYVGAAVGFGANSFAYTNVSTVGPAMPGAPVTTTTDKVDAGKIGFDGKVDAGYNFALSDSFIVGLEATYQVGSAKADMNHNIDVTNTDPSKSTSSVMGAGFEISSSYGLDANLGYMINQSNMVFLTAGYQRAKVKVSATYTPGDKPHALGDSHVKTDSKSKNVNGIRLGIGAEQELSDNLSLVETMDLDTFKKINMSAGKSTVGGTNSQSLKSKELTALVGINYSFG